MLKFIRRNAEAPWVKFMFMAIVIVFIFWGMGGIVSGNKVQVVARVNDDTIEPDEFVRVYNNLLRLYQDAYKDNFKPELIKGLDLKGRALDQLIRVSLLKQEAQRIGLRVGESEIRDAIITLPAFQEDGRFNREIYIRALRANGLTPGDFENSERDELLVTKIQDLITAGVHVTDAEVHNRFAFENEKVNLRFVKIDPDTLAAHVQLSDDDLKAFYDKNRDTFREPERAKIEYLLYAPDQFTAKAVASDADVQDYYDAHAAEYEKPEQVHARHILIKVDPGASTDDKAQARQKAEEVLAKIKGGADFAEMAKQYSQDPSNAQEGGDLGSFTRGKMVKPFDEAAFSLEPGQVSDVVETQFGFHIIKVESHEDAHTQPLDEVREQIVTAVKQQQAQQLAQAQAEADRAKAAGGATLSDIAGGAGMPVVNPAPFAKTEAVGALGRLPELANAVFGTKAGEVGDVISTPKGAILFRVDELIASHVPELAEIHDKVAAAARKQRAGEQAKAQAETLLNELKQSNLDAVAKAHQLSIETTGPFARQGTYVPKVGSSAELKKDAFQLTTDKPLAPSVYSAGGSYVLVVLQERVPADEGKFAADKDNLRRQLQEQRKQQAVDEFINYLKARAAIHMDEDFLAGVQETGHPLSDGGPRRRG